MNEGTPPDASAPVPDSQSKPLGDVIAINEKLQTDPTIVSGLMDFEMHPTIVALERAEE